MATSDNQNEWLKDIERLFVKSAEANKQMLKDSAATMKRVLSGKAKIADGLNAEDLGKTMSDWLRLNLRYTENMIDLGLSWSKSVAELFLPKEAATAEVVSSSRNASPPPPPAHHEIVMSGDAGETIATSLQLNSSLPGIQKGHFEATNFRQDGTGKFASIALSFDPENFEIPPGESVSATLAVVVPKSIQPASYRSKVVVHGFENTAFDLVVQVSRPAAVPHPAAVAKKTPLKKKTPTKKAPG